MQRDVLHRLRHHQSLRADQVHARANSDRRGKFPRRGEPFILEIPFTAHLALEPLATQFLTMHRWSWCAQAHSPYFVNTGATASPGQAYVRHIETTMNCSRSTFRRKFLIFSFDLFKSANHPISELEHNPPSLLQSGRCASFGKDWRGPEWSAQ